MTAGHMNPPSSVQSFAQPSPESLLPSSHCSPVSTAPLPQVIAHAWFLPELSRQLGSFVQVFEQPLASPKNRPFGPLQPVGTFAGSVPQSQPSLPSFTPLPQTVPMHLPGAGAPDVVFGQVAPGSTWQTAEQPSPSVLLPSSHCSPPTIMLSPQAATQGRPGTRHS